MADAEDDFDDTSLCTATPHFVIVASETGWNVQAKATEAGRPDEVFITMSGNNFAEVRRPGRVVRPPTAGWCAVPHAPPRTRAGGASGPAGRRCS